MAMLQAHHKRHPKPKTVTELKKNVAVNPEQPTPGTDRQGCEGMLYESD